MTKSKVQGAAPGMTRLERARVVRDRVLTFATTHGRWQEIQVGAAHQNRMMRTWTIDPGLGWSAMVDTPFTRHAQELVDADLHASAHQGISVPQSSEQTVTVYWADFGKVVSIAHRAGEDTLIGFTAGPWEAAFDLPVQAWPPAVGRRLQDRTA